MLFQYFLIGVSLFVSLTRANEKRYFRSEFLDEDKKVRLSWTNPKENVIEFEYEAPATGWIGIGFSPSGGMNGADMFVVWTNSTNGQVEFLDGITMGRTVFEDLRNDYELLECERKENSTLVRFTRKVDTCDLKEDFLITRDTVSVIYAFSEDSDFDQRLYHGFSNRGARSLRLFDPAPFDRSNFDIKNRVDITSPPMAIPPLETLYLCSIQQFPQKAVKQHVIGFEPLIAKESLPYVHHMAMYRCHYKPEQRSILEDIQLKHPTGMPCFDDALVAELCFVLHFVWTYGGEGIQFPNDAGFPIPASGETDLPIFYRLEMHYDNPDKLDNLPVDTSGFRFYVTEDLRKYDMGLLFLGNVVDSSLIIPPNQDLIEVVSHCPGSCTSVGLPQEGVTVFSNLLHAHFLGKHIRVRHWRDGVEIEPLDTDSYYDFNYQTFRVYEPGMKKILPGDHLTVECDFSSTDKSKTTFGGWPSNYEMCQSMMLVYPYTDNNLWTCWSNLTFEQLAPILRLPLGSTVRNAAEDYYQYEVIDKNNSSKGYLGDYLEKQVGWATSDVERLQELFKNAPKTVSCTTADKTEMIVPLPVTNYPEGDPWTPAPRQCGNEN